MLKKVLIAGLVMMASPVVAQAQDQNDHHQRRELHDVRELLVLMDKDKSGEVSKDEFLAFMSAEFDRLDVDHNGSLDAAQLQGLRVLSRHHTGGSGK